jgi:hypothetical protein
MCKCVEDGDCLLWTGKKHKNGAPAGTEWVDGRDWYVGVRRRAYEEYHGITLTSEDQITATCRNPACLKKEHLECIDVSERVRRMHANMDAAAKLRRSKSLAAAQQKMAGRVDPEQVAAIRESTDGPYVTAQRLGVNGVVASRIKRGVSYRDYSATPWQGLA